MTRSFWLVSYNTITDDTSVWEYNICLPTLNVEACKVLGKEE